MGIQVVTFEGMVDLAIGTGCAINFCVLKKLLKILSRYCCKNDKFEIDMDNLSADVKVIAKQLRSSVSESSDDTNDKRSANKETKVKSEKHGKIEYDDYQVKSEKDSQVYSSEGKTYDSSSDIPKVSGRGSEKPTETSEREDSEKEHKAKEKKEKKRRNDSDSDREDSEKEHKAKEKKEKKRRIDSDSDREDSEKEHKAKEKKEKKRRIDSDSDREDSEREHKAKEKKEKKHKNDSDSDQKNDSKKKKEVHDDYKQIVTRTTELETSMTQLSNRVGSMKETNELETRITQLSDRIGTITETIGTLLNAEHLAAINTEIDKLRKSTEMTNDQCYQAANSINDQSTQIHEILTTINDIQLRKVETEELTDLLSGKADYSFVNEKVSVTELEERIQELKDTIGESAIQLDSVRLETNTSLEEIKQELLTRLLAEEFDEAKANIYKELMKLTEQNTLILAQQNDHVAAGARMRDLNCFVCNNDVVMLVEQEIIPKFRPLKPSIPPMEPIVGSKVMVDKNAPEWKNHLLQTRDYTRGSKATRFQSNKGYENSSYVEGRNGCMYKGNVGCKCMGANSKRGKCCGMVEANNMKNISLTNRMNSQPNIDKDIVIKDVADGNGKQIDNKTTATQIISTEHQEEKSNVKFEDAETVAEVITIKVETPVETLEETVKIENPVAIEIKEEVVTTTVSNIPLNTANEDNGILADTNDGMPDIKTENDESAANDNAPMETNNDTQEGDDGTTVNQ